MSFYIDDQIFKNLDYTLKGIEKSNYENCQFINCNFQALDLGGFKFNDCTFQECNLSMTKTVETSFNSNRFVACKLVGMWFDTCNSATIKVEFDSCQLNHTSFAGLRLKNIVFKNCNLYEVDFSNADLTNSVFFECDMTRAVFDNTILEMADLESSFGFSINPNMTKLRKTKFSRSNIIGLTNHLDIIVVNGL